MLFLDVFDKEADVLAVGRKRYELKRRARFGGVRKSAEMIYRKMLLSSVSGSCVQHAGSKKLEQAYYPEKIEQQLFHSAKLIQLRI
jgi:hypothetical protein